MASSEDLPRAGDETIVCIKVTKDGRYIAYNPYGRFSTAFVIEATVPEAYDALQELIARLAFYDRTLEIIGDELKEIAPRRYPENG